MRVIVEGPTASGKTTTICRMAAAMSAAGQEVMIVNDEDSRSILRRRLVEAGANLDNVLIADEQQASTERVVFIERHMPKAVSPGIGA